MPDLLKSVEDGVDEAHYSPSRGDECTQPGHAGEFAESLEEASGLARYRLHRGAACRRPCVCAGGDVKSMGSRARSEQDLRGQGSTTFAPHAGVEICTDGQAHHCHGEWCGGRCGLSIALATDMRFAGKSARMTTAFAKVRFLGDFGSHYFLHKLVGTGKARELYFTAEILNVEQMEKLVLVNRVIEDDKLESETMAFRQEAAAGPRVAGGTSSGT